MGLYTLQFCKYQSLLYYDLKLEYILCKIIVERWTDPQQQAGSYDYDT